MRDALFPAAQHYVSSFARGSCCTQAIVVLNSEFRQRRRGADSQFRSLLSRGEAYVDCMQDLPNMIYSYRRTQRVGTKLA
eukprot:1196201-Prorocentrum_minimum.AAC.6